MRLPRSDALDLEARQLLGQGQRGGVRDPLVALCGVKKRELIRRTTSRLATSCTVTLVKSEHLPQVVFEAGDPLVQTQFVELVVATRQNFAGLSQEEGSVAATRHRGDAGAFGDLHLWEQILKCRLVVPISEVKKRFHTEVGQHEFPGIDE